MTDNTNEPREQPLESWKEIAVYLKRDVRTVIRWEKREGLPVHRQMHQARSSVYAYPSELEAWKIDREPGLNAPPVITPWRWATSGFAIVAAMLLALVTMGSGPIRTPSAAAAELPDGITTRQVWAGPKTDFYGAVSPDGKYLSFVDWETGDLAIRDLTKEANRRLTNKGTWEASKAEAEHSVWSPDGKQIAYQWFRWDTEPARYELRLINVDNPVPRVLYRCKGPKEWIYPIDWSPDGRNILATLTEGTRRQIVLVLVPQGTARVLKTLSRSVGLVGAAISPDGQYIVYDYPQSESSLSHDIYLLPITGGKETPVIEYPANDRVLGWAPDGKWVLFTSDRRGSIDVWAIRMESGKSQGAALMVKSGLGRTHALGVTRNGSFYFGVGGNGTNVYAVKLDPTTGKVLVPPRKLVKRFEGYNRGPAYSPDGKYLAYISKRSGGDTLCLLSLKTGEEREYQRELIRAGLIGLGGASPSWSPDGQSLLLTGRDSRGRYGIYQLSLETGKAVRILNSDENLIGLARWRDRTSFFYGWGDKRNKRGEFRLRDLNSGKERIMHRVSMSKHPWATYAVSPDRHWLSVIDKSKSGEKILSIISVDSGELERLFKLNQENQPYSLRHVWSADGKYVIYVRRVDTQDSTEWTVCRLPVDGGQPQETDLGMPNIIGYMSANPDGEHLAFENPSGSEAPAVVWVMENFLPKAVAAM